MSFGTVFQRTKKTKGVDKPNRVNLHELSRQAISYMENGNRFTRIGLPGSISQYSYYAGKKLGEIIINRHKNVKSQKDHKDDIFDLSYEYCPNCNANLTLQREYNNDLPYWICKGCGEMLINPDVDAEDNVAWFCDQCESILNVQTGFNSQCGEWRCTVCSFLNKIDERNVYSSEDEYQTALKDPYRGLSNENVDRLSLYHEKGHVTGRADIIFVEDKETHVQYVKKLLTTYNKSVYEFLLCYPIARMPKVEAIYESSNCLIVIEEYIAGKTVAELLDDGPVPESTAIRIAREVCVVLKELHTLPTPLIHRDIKPSNIIVTPEGDIYLLDMNVAKWYDPEETDDTRYLGTRYFAAPEQVGFGLTASSVKTDIYAVGILLNVMLTGNYPKEQKVSGRLWEIIERCISLEAQDRFTAGELIEKLDELGE